MKDLEKEIKKLTESFVKELVALLKSRGFKIDCPAAQRLTLVKDIMSYLKANKDPEFNIRLGAIILRNRLKNLEKKL